MRIRGRWLAAAAAVCGAKLAVHAAVHPAYGFHRDELLYLSMADHLDLFRMQFPPFIALAGRAVEGVAGGEPLQGVRVAAALAGTALTAVTMLLAGALGGGGRAWALTGLAVLVAPVFLRAGTLFQPVVFEQVWWTLGVYALARLLGGRDRRWWIALGAALGLGGLTKFSVAFFGVGVATAVVAGPLRADLRTRWPWLALGLAAVVALPSVTGQAAWGWPFFEQMAALRRSQLGRVSRIDFLTGQLLMLGAAAPLAVAGLGALAVQPRLARFRALAVLYLVVGALLLAGRAKEYYLAPLAPLLLAAGAVASERLPRKVWIGAAAVLLAGGALLAPIGVPLLGPPTMARYAARVGLTRAVTTNRGDALRLPQDYADMTGWDALVDAVGGVFHALPEAERRRAVLIAGNYGEAGALQVLGTRRGLPAPISAAGDFYHWGPGPLPGEVAVTVGLSAEDLAPFYDACEERVRVSEPWAVSEERDVPVLVCRRPRRPLQAVWPELGPRWG